MSTPSRPGGSGSGGRQPEKGSGTARPVSSGSKEKATPPVAAEARGGGAAARPTTPPWQRGTATTVSGPAVRGSGPKGPALDSATTKMKPPDLPSDMPDLSAVPRNSYRPPARTGTVRDTGERQSGAARPEKRPIASVQSSRKGPRRASLQVKHIDPWSVLKLSLVLSFALFLVWMVAIGVLYLVLDGMGVWERLNTTFTDFVSVNDPNSRSAPLIGPGRVFGVAAIVGAVNIVLLTALATIGSFIYNLTSDLVGGVEVMLTERD
ncbi:MAG: DUF3566 domain-containing protein [Mycobacteriaceae bacterium]